jgi:two-component system phosphate regulon sensor histidine kinase PhoR
MYAETLELGRVPGEERKTHYYRIIVNETHRLTRLINNILEFSKIEQRKKDFRKTWTNLRPIALSVLDMYRFHLQQLNFEVTQDLDSDTPEVFVDADAVSQALVNLLDNAVKFSREDRRIHLSLKRFDGHVVLSVQDHGIGISDQEQTKVFEKFYRARSGITHATPGSGLGLSLVKHVLEVHGGRIALKSQPGVGSVFSMVFPIHPEEIPQ